MIHLPRTSTVARILRDDATAAHNVAYDICHSQCIYWCQVAAYRGKGAYDDQTDHTRNALAHLLGGLNAAEYSGRVACRAVRRVWDDARDCCDQSDIGRFDIADGTPQGCIDVCGAAGIVAASITGLVEPTDDYGAIIEEWYRDIIEREWCPRSMIAWMRANEAKWPVPTEFRRRLDSRILTYSQ